MARAGLVAAGAALACCVLQAAPAPRAGAAQDAVAGVEIRITSPADGGYVSGVTTLGAEITPLAATARLQDVTFSVDGRIVCRLTALPLVCEWDAGERVDAHVIRVVATFPEGRVTDSVQTKSLDLAEVVDVDAVQVITVVTDEQGRFVRDLPQEAFHVFEDEVPQTIGHFESENIPLEATAAIDISLSMKMAMPEVKAAVRRFLLALQPGHEVTIIAFNENLWTLARRGTDPKARARVVDRLNAWGSTALYDAIMYGYDLLGQRSGRRAMVIFTDGDDKVSHATVEAVVRRAESSDATLYMIGQGQAADNTALQTLLTRLADISGGRAFFETDAERLGPIFDDILQDLSNQYLISYQPTNPAIDDRWRAIRVEVDGPGYQVRARQGYRRVRQ